MKYVIVAILVGVWIKIFAGTVLAFLGTGLAAGFCIWWVYRDIKEWRNSRQKENSEKVNNG